MSVCLFVRLSVCPAFSVRLLRLLHYAVVLAMRLYYFEQTQRHCSVVLGLTLLLRVINCVHVLDDDGSQD